MTHLSTTQPDDPISVGASVLCSHHPFSVTVLQGDPTGNLHRRQLLGGHKLPWHMHRGCSCKHLRNLWLAFLPMAEVLELDDP